MTNKLKKLKKEMDEARVACDAARDALAAAIDAAARDALDAANLDALDAELDAANLDALDAELDAAYKAYQTALDAYNNELNKNNE